MTARASSVRPPPGDERLREERAPRASRSDACVVNCEPALVAGEPFTVAHINQPFARGWVAA
jgi:hypothetical protein